MPNVQDYIPFVNSSDFEKIYKESLSILIDFYPNIPEFYRKYVCSCVLNKTIKLLYNENKIIGYVMYSIKNRVLKFHFYYITSQNKNRRYGRFFRERIFNDLKNEVDSLETSINKTNFIALNAAKKTCEKLNLKFIKKEIDNPMLICKQYICEIRKKPLDNTPNVCDTHEQ